MTSYTVETVAGCTVLRGNVPVAVFGALARTMQRKSLIDPGAGMRLGAAFVVGTQAQLDALRAANVPAGPEVQQDMANARLAGLSPEAIAWLDGYERGTSSNLLFSVTTGVPVSDSENHLPRDAADLRRCVELARSVPEVRQNLHRAAEVSAGWRTVVENWAEFEQLLEAPSSALHTRLRACRDA